MKTFIAIIIGVGVGLLWSYGWDGPIIGGVVAVFISSKLNN